MLYTLTLNPALDRTVTVPGFTPGAVNRVLSERIIPGGKGINVSKVLRQLGTESVAFGICGGSAGRQLLHSLAMRGIETDFVTVPGETRTNLKIVCPETEKTTELNTPGVPVTPAAYAALRERLWRRIRQGDTLVLAGSLPQGLPADTYAVLARQAAAHGVRVLADTSGEPLRHALSAGITAAKPNADELRALCGRPVRTPMEAAAAAVSIGGDVTLLVTLGADGAVLVSQGHAMFAPAPAVHTVCTTGAGDAATAALALALTQDMTGAEALALAVACGSANATTEGTEPALREQVYQLLPAICVTDLF